MAQSSKFARLDEDVLIEFIYHDQSNTSNYTIDTDNNGSEIKILNIDAVDDSAQRFLINELGADVVNFNVTKSGSNVSINNFISRQLVLKSGKTYKFDLSDVSVNSALFSISGGGITTLSGDIYTYTPNTYGTYQYVYDGENSGEINVSNRANPLFSESIKETGNTIKTAVGEVGRYYAVPTDNSGRFALVDNGLNYLDEAEWLGTASADLNTTILASNEICYDTIRLHLRSGYSFSGRGYDGFLMQVSAKRISGVDNILSSIVYKNSSSFEIQNPNPFILGETAYSKYVQIKVPSLYQMSNINSDFHTAFFGAGNDAMLPTSNYGVSFKLINNTTEINNIEFIDVEDTQDLVISQEDEYTDISANVAESSDGDYFNLYGTFNGDQGEFESYINRRIQTSSDDITVYHDVEVSEQLGLSYLKTSTMSFVQTSEYDKSIKFRPIIEHSNISNNFFIRYTMRILNETDNTQIIKVATLTYSNPKKYGIHMDKIDIGSTAASVIYNKLPNSSVNVELNEFVNSIRPTIGEVKYIQVAVDTHNIVTNASHVKFDETELVTEENTGFNKENTITISKVSDNFIKFNIARLKDKELHSLSLINAEDIILYLKSNDKSIHEIHHDVGFPDIDLGKGEVLFKINKSIASLLTPSDSAKFYINLKNGESETFLCHGKLNII